MAWDMEMDVGEREKEEGEEKVIIQIELSLLRSPNVTHKKQFNL